jgi:hypothetical protein
MGKANHLKPIHTGGTSQHHDTPEAGKENWPHAWTFKGHRTGETMATNPELTDRTPGFSRGR